MSDQFLHLQHRNLDSIYGGTAGNDQGDVPVERYVVSDDPQSSGRFLVPVNTGCGDHGPDGETGEPVAHPAGRSPYRYPGLQPIFQLQEPGRSGVRGAAYEDPL